MLAGADERLTNDWGQLPAQLIVESRKSRMLLDLLERNFLPRELRKRKYKCNGLVINFLIILMVLTIRKRTRKTCGCTYCLPFKLYFIT